MILVVVWPVTNLSKCSLFAVFYANLLTNISTDHAQVHPFSHASRHEWVFYRWDQNKANWLQKVWLS